MRYKDDQGSFYSRTSGPQYVQMPPAAKPSAPLAYKFSYDHASLSILLVLQVSSDTEEKPHSSDRNRIRTLYMYFIFCVFTNAEFIPLYIYPSLQLKICCHQKGEISEQTLFYHAPIQEP